MNEHVDDDDDDNDDDIKYIDSSIDFLKKNII